MAVANLQLQSTTSGGWDTHGFNNTRMYPIIEKYHLPIHEQTLPTLLTDLDPKKIKIVSVDALAAELPYIDTGLAPVLFAQPTYLWGYVSVKTIYDHVHDKKEVPAHVQMDLVRVSKDNLGAWARQLKEWGFTDVDPKYLTLKN